MKRLTIHDAGDGTRAPRDCPDATARKARRALERAHRAGLISGGDYDYARAQLAAWLADRRLTDGRAAA